MAVHVAVASESGFGERPGPEGENTAPLGIPTSLYVHLPWCVSKCPYCDFNSHALKGPVPARRYVDALLSELRQERASAGRRELVSIFFGGGTPSLFPAEELARLLTAARRLFGFAPGIEITLEANPGTAEAERFAAYAAAGINRLSLGVQSFDAGALQRLGRIHGPAEIERAFGLARDAGFANINLDLMYGLPGQTPAAALSDLERALALEPEHVSHYQLTLEPGTAFHRRPPPLPDEDSVWDMLLACRARLAAAGFRHYEVSAYARSGRACRHNLNYWRFGDYLGVGAGAHGKLTSGTDGSVWRIARHSAPRAYLARVGRGEQTCSRARVAPSDLPFEFTLNALRLTEGFRLELFEQRTGLPASTLDGPLSAALERGLLELPGGVRVRPTARGRRFLNDLQVLFLP